MDIANLNDIRIFAALSQEGTLTAAAAKLKLPTSTVSRALTRLERNLNVLLVKRNSRGLVLTDSGRKYLQVCRQVLRTLREGGDTLAAHRERPSGLLKVACPITMAQTIFAPLLTTFLERYPDLQVDIEPYSSGWDQEAREDIDVFFKVRAPGDSMRRVRRYPGVNRGLFAGAAYLERTGMPSSPEALTTHKCIGSGTWKLQQDTLVVTPGVKFQVVTSDPAVHLTLTLQNLGIAVLPLYMQTWPEAAGKLVQVLPQWNPAPISLCALFSGQSRLTPKVQVLLDFLGEYIGTPRDPRLHGSATKNCFTDPHHEMRKREATSEERTRKRS